MKLISLTENGKPVLINPDHIMYIGKGVNHAGQEVDLIVLSSGMSVKPDDITKAMVAVWAGDGDELLFANNSTLTSGFVAVDVTPPGSKLRVTELRTAPEQKAAHDVGNVRLDSYRP